MQFFKCIGPDFNTRVRIRLTFKKSYANYMLSVDCRLENNILCIIVEVLLCAFICAKYRRKVTGFQPPMRLYNVCLYFEIVLQGNLELIEFDCQISPV